MACIYNANVSQSKVRMGSLAVYRSLVRIDKCNIEAKA